MSTRAIWRGTIVYDDERIPVKIFSAIEDRSIRFRLLHEEDAVPLRQAMVNPSTGKVVEYSDALRGLEIEPGRFVRISGEELSGLEPEPSREIEVLRFVPPNAINHQWYDRPYFLGPDGSRSTFSAFVRALGRAEREGVVRWTMRKKGYAGALRAEGPHLALLTLRRTGEVISTSDLEPPEGRELERREREMAEKFIQALEERFDPKAFHDEYRARVLELIERKRRGEEVSAPPQEDESAQEPDDLARLLEESIAHLG